MKGSTPFPMALREAQTRANCTGVAHSVYESKGDHYIYSANDPVRGKVGLHVCSVNPKVSK